MTKDHGFVFEVDPINVDNNENPTPLTALGRFAHEAVVIDPETGDRLPHRGRQRAQRAALPRDADHAARRLRLAARRCAARGDRRHRRTAASSPTSPRSPRSARRSTSEWAAIPDPLGRRGLDPRAAHQGHPQPQARGHVVGRRRGLRRRARTPATTTARSASTTGRCGASTPPPNTMELVVQFGVNPDPASDNFDAPGQHHRRRRGAA